LLALSYIEAAGIREDKNGPLFRSVDRKTKMLGGARLDRQRAWEMVKRRAQEAGIETEGICNHIFRGTGITAYLGNPEAKLWSTPRRWRRTRTPRQRGSMACAATRSPSVRSRGSGFERKRI
jgi:hypothetical protein